MSNELRVTSFKGTNPLIVHSNTLQNTRYYSKHRIYVELKQNIVSFWKQRLMKCFLQPDPISSQAKPLLKRKSWRWVSTEIFCCLVFNNNSWSWIVDIKARSVFSLLSQMAPDCDQRTHLAYKSWSPSSPHSSSGATDLRRWSRKSRSR